ncbi:MAG TPA: hypothetical protein VIM17_00550, partial [Jatrophihabitantaceae bacterium]
MQVAPGCDRGEFRRRHHRPSGVRRAGEDDSLRRYGQGVQLRGSRLEARLGPAPKLEDRAAEGGQHVAVGRVSRSGHHHRVTRVERGQEREQEAAGRA